MDALRLSLIVIGIVVVIGVFLWSRRSRPEPGAARREEPSLGAAQDELPDLPEETDAALIKEIIVEDEAPLLSEPAAVAPAKRTPRTEPARTAAPAAEAEQILMLYVTAPRGAVFAGEAVLQAASRCGLQHGEMAIFHRPAQGAAGPLSLANMVEPGTFDLQSLDGFSTPGLVLFARRPGPGDALHTFDALVETARTLAAELGGMVCDERRGPLTAQTVNFMRERIQASQPKRGAEAAPARGASPARPLSDSPR